MLDYGVGRPYVNKSIRELTEKMTDIKNAGHPGKIVVVADSKASCRLLKMSIKEELIRVLSPGGKSGGYIPETLLFNVHFTTFDGLAERLWEEAFPGHEKKFLERHTLLYACRYIKNTWPQMNLQGSTLAGMYEYIRYQRKDSMTEIIMQYFSHSLMRNYVTKVHETIKASYVDKLDVVNELLKAANEQRDRILSYARHYVLFMPDGISNLEKTFYQGLVGLTHPDSRSSINVYTIGSKNTHITLPNETIRPGRHGKDSLDPANHEADSRYSRTDGALPPQSAPAEQEDDLAVVKSVLSESNADTDSTNFWFGSGLNESKAVVEISGQPSIQGEVREAFRYTVQRIAAGAKPHECAVIYFGGETYRQTVRYESSFLQVDHYMDDPQASKKNIFLELMKSIMRIDANAVSGNELVRVLEEVFSVCGANPWETYGDIFYRIADLSQEMGSMGFWRSTMENISKKSENENSGKAADLMDLAMRCLEGKDIPNDILEAVIWLDDCIEGFLACLKSGEICAPDLEYVTYKNVLAQIRRDAVSVGKSEAGSLADVIGTVRIGQDCPNYPGVYIASAEDACKVPFRFVTLLGCSAELMDNPYRKETFKSILGKYLSTGEYLRISYALHGPNSKAKGSVANLVSSLLDVTDTAYSFSEAGQPGSIDHKFPLYSHRDIAGHVLQRSFHGLDAALSPAVMMPISLYFSLQALSARSKPEFNEHMGYVKTRGDRPDNDNFSFSATSLERYQKCPFSYFLKDILGLRGEQYANGYLEPLRNQIGSTVHKILEVYIKVIKDLNFPSTNGADPMCLLENYYDGQALQSYSRSYSKILSAEPHLTDVLTAVTDIEFGRLDRYADSVFRETINGLKQKWLYRLLLWSDRYLESLLDGSRVTLASEYKFSDQPIMKVQSTSQACSEATLRVSGSIDRVDSVGGDTLCVVDYKTGSPDKYQKLKRDQGSIKTFLQLPIYVDVYPEKDAYQAYHAVYDFIAQPEKNIELLIDREILDELHNVIGNVHDLIEHGVFPQNPGGLSQGAYENCRNCDYRSVCSDAQRSKWPSLKSNDYVGQYVATAE